MFFGQIASNKGLDILFPAMLELHKALPDVKLIVAGRGKYSFDITPYKDLDYFDIRNTFIPDYELATLIQNSLFVVCPYKDATQSGVVMSAYAFNKPVIATNVGGFPEQVIHKKYGLIISPNNVEELTQAMELLCTDDVLLTNLQHNILNACKHGEYSWEQIALEMRETYTSMHK